MYPRCYKYTQSFAYIHKLPDFVMAATAEPMTMQNAFLSNARKVLNLASVNSTHKEEFYQVSILDIEKQTMFLSNVSAQVTASNPDALPLIAL